MRNKKVRFILLLSTVFSLVLFFSCENSGDLSTVLKIPSSRNITELLKMDFNDMTEADVDKLNALTGSMSSDDYTAKYGENKSRSVLDDITTVIWGAYNKVDIEGGVCGNNSQYKIFVKKSRGFWNWIKGYTDNLIVYLEPGGACWDYKSCTGQSGIRGAANPNGIPDNFMNFGAFIDPNKEGGSPNAAISPLIFRNHPAGHNLETSRWNIVFVPYCTGDVHAGNRVATYVDSDTGESITYHHKGATNIEKVIAYLKREFPHVDKLMVTGSSAGGVGTLANYHFFRKELSPKKSYMLSDSGPIFSATSDDDNQFRLHQKINTEWNTNYILRKLEVDFGSDVYGDFGKIHEVLADAYPNDPLGMTMFTRDRNFSVYSYARFYDLDEYDADDLEEILTLWGEDIDKLVTTYDQYDNLSYFIPYFRNMNESHCTGIVEFTGTEILNTGIDVGDYIKDILDGNPVNSYQEPVNLSDADVTDFWMELVNLLL